MCRSKIAHIWLQIGVILLLCLVSLGGIAPASAQTTQPTPRPRYPKGANVTVVQRATPNITVRPGDTVTYTISVVNRGEGNAKNARLTLPFDPDQVELLDAQFSHTGAWVNLLEADYLTIETGRLDSAGGTVTATLRFRVLPGVPAGTHLGERISFTWNDDADNGKGRSNDPGLVVAGSTVEQPYYPLAVLPVSGPAGTNRVFSSDIFAPKEPVTFWYNTPTGQIVELGPIDNDEHGIVIANENGAAGLELPTAGLPPGTYSMVAYGNWTGFTAVGAFQVQ